MHPDLLARFCIDFLKVVRMVFWSGVVGPGSRFALGARTIALRAHCRATRSKARLVSKSRFCKLNLSNAKNSARIFFPGLINLR